MSGIIQTRLEIERVLQKSDFVTDTLSQINKDLQEISAHISMENGEDILNGLTNQLVGVFSKIEDVEKLAHFIYRVDLKESDFRKALADSNWSELAYLVIRREAQKVYLRRRFM